MVRSPVRALSRASHDFFSAPPPGFAEAPLVRPRATMHIATAEQADRLAAFAALPDVAQVSRTLSRDEALAICPILRPEQIHSAVVESEAADVDVHGLHQGYLRQLRERGGTLITDRAVDSLRHEGGRWRLSAGGEEFAAPVVVNAAGAWADAIAELAGVASIGLQPAAPHRHTGRAAARRRN